MNPFRYHVLVCDQQKPEGVPSCRARGGPAVIDAFRREIGKAGLGNDVLLTVTGSMGMCLRGPNVVVWPDGVWYSGVGPEDVAEIVEKHFRDGVPVDRLVNRDEKTLHAEICGNRDRAMAAMKARETSGMLPDDLEQTVRGYQESRIILSAIELDLFTATRELGTVERIAKVRGTDQRATTIVLDALTAMGLLAKSNGAYSPTATAEKFFVEGAVHDSRSAMLHHESLWHRWSKLTEIVRTGTGGAFEEGSGRSEDFTRAFIALMHKNASMRAPMVVEAVGTKGVRRMLDVGGGSGAYSIAFAKAADIQAEILDLPSVVLIAEEHVRAAGLESRVVARSGDLRRDALGSGYDLVLVSAICHMLGHVENRDLFRRCRAALAPGGRLVIQDFILDPDRTSPKFAALFSVNMLVSTAQGSDWTGEEYSGWLKDAGFHAVERIALPGPTDLIIAK